MAGPGAHSVERGGVVRGRQLLEEHQRQQETCDLPVIYINSTPRYRYVNPKLQIVSASMRRRRVQLPGASGRGLSRVVRTHLQKRNYSQKRYDLPRMHIELRPTLCPASISMRAPRGLASRPGGHGGCPRYVRRQSSPRLTAHGIGRGGGVRGRRFVRSDSAK